MRHPARIDAQTFSYAWSMIMALYSLKDGTKCDLLDQTAYLSRNGVKSTSSEP